MNPNIITHMNSNISPHNHKRTSVYVRSTYCNDDHTSGILYKRKKGDITTGVDANKAKTELLKTLERYA